jgi:hypothetical protein
MDKNLSEKPIKKLDHQEIRVIEKEIKSCLEEIDPHYYNPKLNLITEIIKIFGDINFEKVRKKIEDFDHMDDKIDQVIKLIVDKHSEKFFQILGFVRHMQKIIEGTQYKLDDAKEILESVNSTLSNLTTKENADWKLKSIFCSEIIQKLTQNHMILKLINDSEIYLKNKKIFDVIALLKKCNNEINKYDKDFRRYDTVVSNNTRIIEIDNKICNSLFDSLSNIFYFKDDLILQRKISSLNFYFINFYSKISIDNEINLPLQKFMYLIYNMIDNNMNNYNFDIEVDKIDQYLNENTIDLDSDKKLTSLPYITKCIKHYENSAKLFCMIKEKMKIELIKFMDRLIKIISEQIKQFDFSKYDLDNSIEKIKFLLFFQNFILIFFHTFAKINAIKEKIQYNDDKEIQNKINFLLLEIENLIILPLKIYFNMASPKDEEKIIDENSEFFTIENLIRMKINQILSIKIDNIPILLKIYFTFAQEVKKFTKIELKNLNKTINNYNIILFEHFSAKLIPKKIFDLEIFTKDYDNDISNFKFIYDLITKLDNLKYFSIFTFENGNLEIVKIFKDIFKKFTEDTKSFIDKIKERCVYKGQYNNIFNEISKLIDYKELTKIMEFKKYEQVIIEKNDCKLREKLNNMINNTIWNSVILPNDQVILLARNYKLLELLTKFISSSIDLITKGELFVSDLMRKEFSNEKIIAIQEQVSSLHFIDFTKETKDLSFSLIIALKTLEKFNEEIGRLTLICRLELDFSLVKLLKNINKNDYWLSEAQMVPEFFVNSFLDEFNSLNNLFNEYLPYEQYLFIMKDLFIFLNFNFINCVKNLQSNTINHFGIKLLIRNFEFIKEKIFNNIKDTSFSDRDLSYKNKFMNSIYYFPNFIKTLDMSNEEIEINLKRYFEILPYDEDIVKSLLNIRTSMRNSIADSHKNNIIGNIFNNK